MFGVLILVDCGLWSLFFSFVGIGVLIWGICDVLVWVMFNCCVCGCIVIGFVVVSGRIVFVMGVIGFLG